MSETKADKAIAAVKKARQADEAAEVAHTATRANLAKSVAKAIAAGAPVVHVAKAAGVSRAQAYTWSGKHGGGKRK